MHNKSMATTADILANKATLTQRAPNGPIPSKTWELFFNPFSWASFTWQHHLEQKFPCIRSQTATFSTTSKITSTSTPVTSLMTQGREIVSFPYPSAFRELVSALDPRMSLEDPEAGGSGSAITQTSEPRDAAPSILSSDDHVSERVQQQQQVNTVSWQVRLFETIGVKRTWETKRDRQALEPVYVVLGVFPRGHANPRERVVFVNKPKHLFWKLSWGIFCLRGVTGSFFSLRHVKGFRLYKVCRR